MERIWIIGLIAFLLSSIASATDGIALSNFRPLVTGLPPACEDVYTRTIPACTSHDFKPPVRCSDDCIDGLVEITKALSENCKNVKVSEGSIVGVFLRGDGVPSLCRGQSAPSAESSPAPTSTSPQKSRTSESSSFSKSQQQSSSARQTSSSSTKQLAQSTPSPQPTSAAQPSPQQSSATPSPTPTAQGQKSNQDSGGGSPFDIAASGETRLAAGRDVMGISLAFITVLFTSMWIWP